MISHGMTEHSGCYGKFGRWVAQRGGVAFAIDQVGHGVTHVGRLGELGPAGWGGVRHRIHRFFSSVIDHYPSISWVALGHSMGSFLVQDVIARYRPRLAGVILTGATIESRIATGFGLSLARVMMTVQGKLAPAGLIHEIVYGGFNRHFNPTRTAFDWLSRDRQMVDAYIADPLCGFVPPLSFYFELFQGIYRLFQPAHFKTFPELPMLILSGAQDPVTHFGRGSITLAGRYGVAPQIFPNLRHVILDEVDNDVVYEAIGAFIDKNTRLG